MWYTVWYGYTLFHFFSSLRSRLVLNGFCRCRIDSVGKEAVQRYRIEPIYYIAEILYLKNRFCLLKSRCRMFFEMACVLKNVRSVLSIDTCQSVNVLSNGTQGLHHVILFKYPLCIKLYIYFNFI